MWTETIPLYHLNKVIKLPVDNETEEKLARINWAQQIEGTQYRIGVTFIDAYPYDEGSSIWEVEITKEGLKPIACSLYGNKGAQHEED